MVGIMETHNNPLVMAKYIYICFVGLMKTPSNPLGMS